MKPYLFKALGTIMIAGLVSTCTLAQDNSNKLDENQQIIITKKGEKKSKLTVEINDGEVKVNGRPLSEFNDDNVSIRIENNAFGRVFPPNIRSPFRSYNGNDMVYFSDGRGFLGVTTEDDENGAKVKAVTSGSAAEKAGLKAGDVIAKVNDTKIENARGLTETIGKLKADEKIAITIKRDNKEQRLTATLRKRSNTMIAPGDINMENFRFENFGLDGTTAVGMNRGRLGIKAQDTEDEKGVKVLEVDADSHAAKSGIKAGDLITNFNGGEVNSATELAEAARDARDKNSIPVTISRDGKTQSLEIKVPKKLRTANL